jgi:hypothetical protein
MSVRMLRAFFGMWWDEVSVVLFDHVDAGAHQLGQEPAVV